MSARRTRVATHLIRSCWLSRRWFGDQIRNSAPGLTRIVRMNTPWSFVSRARPTGFHTFLRSTSSRYRFRPGRPSRIWPQTIARSPASAHLSEGQPECLQRGLPAVVHEHEPGLEPAQLWLVAVQVLDQHRHPRQPPRAHRGEAEIRRLPLEGHAQERVRRICLVAVLRQPDRLRPEVALDEDEELPDRRHRDPGAVLAAAAGRRLGRRRGIRVVGVGVELRAGGRTCRAPRLWVRRRPQRPSARSRRRRRGHAAARHGSPRTRG